MHTVAVNSTQPSHAILLYAAATAMRLFGSALTEASGARPTGWEASDDSMAKAVLRSVRMVRPSGSFLDQSQACAGVREVWRQPCFRSRTVLAVATRCWRKRMSVRTSAKERGSVAVSGGFMGDKVGGLGSAAFI